MPPRFLLRGCIPSTWTQPPDVVEPAMAEEHGPWAHNPSPLHASPRVYGAGDGSGRKQSKDPRYRRCGYGLVVVNSWGSLKPVLTCYGGLNGRQTVPRAELQAFVCFLRRTEGPATNICDAMGVAKGFQRRRQGRRWTPNSKQDLWSHIRNAAEQRDIEVHWVASHEESKIDQVDASKAWFIFLNTLADGVAEAAAEFCEFPDTVPALTSWVEGKSWAIRHRAALTTLDAIEKDPVASLPSPKRVKPTMADLKHASEHDVVEHLNSVTCNRCGQRAPRRAALLKRWLKSQCHVGQRVTLPDGTQRIAPVPGQGASASPDNPPVAQLHLLPWP